MTWSLIKGRGGGYKTKRGGGGASEVKRGAEKALAMLKGVAGGTTSVEVVLTRELEVLAILMEEGTKSFHLLKGATRKDLPCLEGERKKFLTRDFPFCSPPPLLPVINDQSLSLSLAGVDPGSGGSWGISTAPIFG